MSPPKKWKAKPLPKREREICGRLRALREALDLSQEKFAREAGMMRERLATYEKLRVALRLDVALRICGTFIVSERWLATGEGHMRQYMGTKPGYMRLKAGLLFSEAYDKILKDRYHSRLLRHPHSAHVELSWPEEAAHLDTVSQYYMEYWRAHLTERSRALFFRDLLQWCSQEFSKHQKGETPAGATGTPTWPESAEIRFDLPLWQDGAQEG